MKQLVILSGKGGTGKTTLASSFIKLSDCKAFADCDVEAPNLDTVFASGGAVEKKPYFGLKKAVKHDGLCIGCGKCESLCRFGAIEDGKVNPYKCEGCGVCERFCPAKDEKGQKAIRLEDRISGETELYNSKGHIFSTAKLDIGSGASGRLVSEVRANLYSASGNAEFVIIDGSPGIGCPVIASITGVTMALIVAEPTVSGIHDMKRIVAAVRRFGAKIAVCVNKFDVSKTNTEKILEYCKSEDIPAVGLIPYDGTVIKAVNEGKTIADYDGSPACDAIKDVCEKVRKMFLA